MAAEITNENYNGLATLYANAGQWVDASVQFYNEYRSQSDSNERYFLNNDVIEIEYGTWLEKGWLPGMTITIEFTASGVGFQSFTRTVNYVNGNLLYLDSGIGSFGDDTFPSPDNSTMTIEADQSPETVEFFFNLSQNGTPSVNSVIDNQVNQFVNSNIANIPVAGSEPMTQINLKSGGWIKDVTINRLADSGIRRQYRIDYKFFQWGLIQDGFNPPNWYDAANSLTPTIQIQTTAINGNTNGILEAQNATQEANTGWFNENYNGGVNNYALVSIDWKDFNGNAIEAWDYSNECTFTAICNAPNQNTTSSRYRIGTAWMPIDATEYQGKPDDIGNNLLINAPEVEFLHTASPSPTVYTGEENQDGVRFDLTNLQFEILPGDQLRVTGKIIPVNASAFFDQYADGERRMIIWVRIANFTLTNQFSDEVNLLIFDDDNYDAPTIGVQYPYVRAQEVLDHAGNDITFFEEKVGNTTTEDDVLYRAFFHLEEGEQYDGINTRIFARNLSTGEEFTLESLFFDFNGQPYVNGKHEVNMTANRGFLLPIGTDRNTIEVKRFPTLDIPGFYGMNLEYGFLNNWRYWLEDPSVSLEFFDTNQPNNGLNKNWQRFSFNNQGTGFWQVWIAFYVRKNDVDDYHEYKYRIRPYEDDPNVSTAITFTRQDGSQPTNLVQDEVIEIECKFLWNQTFDQEWATIRAEDFEGNVIGFISTEYDQQNQPGNVLKPIAGQTRLTKNNLGTTLECKCLIDTSTINANEVSLSYRVSSEPRAETNEKTMTDGTVKTTTYGTDKTIA